MTSEQIARMDRLKTNILKVLEDAPKHGYNLNSIRVKLPALMSHALVHNALLELLADGCVWRTPMTCLWRLA